MGTKKTVAATRKVGKVSKSGRNPAQKPTVVTRVKPAGKSRSLGPGPVTAASELAGTRTPPRGSAGSQGGMTAGGAKLPDRPRRSKPTTISGTPNVRDDTQPGTTISSRANAAGRRRKAAG